MSNDNYNYRERAVESVDSPVAIGHDEKGLITLWAYEEYGDEPSRLTPEQAVKVAEALLEAAKEAS